MHYNPERVFDAALAVAHIAYAPDLYWGGGEGEATTWQVLHFLHDNRISIPKASGGAYCTTGGLAVYVYECMPVWMETPWGEWQCFGGESVLRGDPIALCRYLSRLSLDRASPEGCRVPKSSDEWRGSPSHVVPLRAVGDFVLPRHVRTNRDHEDDKACNEWVALARAHIPPHPLPEYYAKQVAEAS